MLFAARQGHLLAEQSRAKPFAATQSFKANSPDLQGTTRIPDRIRSPAWGTAVYPDMYDQPLTK